jgi:hypothetical protein
MTGSINDFRTSFNVDVARPSRFDVQIPLPVKLLMYYNTATSLNFRCETAELPSISFGTTEQKIYGPTEKYPNQLIYNDSTFTFIVSDDMREKIFFDGWMQLINPNSTYDFGYKGDYSTTIQVNQYDVTGALTYSVSLIDAFPISVNQLDLDWSNTDSHHKLSVVFAYHSWQNTSLSALGTNLLSAGIGAVADLASSALAGALGVGPTTPPSWDMTKIASTFKGTKL